MSGSGVATNFSCSNYFNRVYFCASSWPRDRPSGPSHAVYPVPPAASYQFQRYYRTGGFDDCSEAFDDLSTCMKIKISKDEDAKVRARGRDAIAPGKHTHVPVGPTAHVRGPRMCEVSFVWLSAFCEMLRVPRVDTPGAA